MTKIKIKAGRDEVEISERALQLLQDIAELEDAGLLECGGTSLAQEGYDEGSFEVDMPPTVTHKGRLVLKEINTSQDAPN